MWTRFEVEERKKGRTNLEKKIIDRSIKNRIIKDIRTLFEQEDDGYYYFKPKRVSNFWNNNYMEYESNGDRDKNLLIDKYLNKTKP